MKLKMIIMIILIQFFTLQNYCFGAEEDQNIKGDEQQNVLLGFDVIGPLIGLYCADVEFRLYSSGSLRIGLLYLNPDLNILKDIVTIEYNITASDGTVHKYTEDFYAIGTTLQYNVLLNNHFPNSLYIGFGTNYVLLSLDDDNNPELSGIYTNFTPFVLFGLQSLINNILYRIEIGLQYPFPAVKFENLFSEKMFDLSKAEGFGVYFNLTIGLGL